MSQATEISESILDSIAEIQGWNVTWSDDGHILTLYENSVNYIQNLFELFDRIQRMVDVSLPISELYNLLEPFGNTVLETLKFLVNSVRKLEISLRLSRFCIVIRRIFFLKMEMNMKIKMKMKMKKMKIKFTVFYSICN